MNYKEAIEYIHGTQKFGSILGLDRIKLLLDYMGNPHKKLKFVHVAGTNGKGSTVAFISSILIEAGYKVGIFTSPSIQRFSERIKINDFEISEENIARITSMLKENVDKMIRNDGSSPTEFELVAALAFQYFFEQGCDIIVLEVGLGGRLDATNIIETAEVSVITTINYDHMDVLGDTLSKIAFEKAGIIKENNDVVLYPQERDVERVFETVCREKVAKLHKVDFSTLKNNLYDITKQKFDFEGYKSLKVSLLGEHQIKNAAVAIKTVEVLFSKGYLISENDIRRGLIRTKWAGRFEMINECPFFIIDGAHNIEGTKTLADNLRRYFPGKKITFITGVLADKDYKSMMEAVIPLAEGFITVTPNSPRALSSTDLEMYLKSYCRNVANGGEIREAIKLSLELASKDEIICAFGSLYYIGQVREYFGLM